MLSAIDFQRVTKRIGQQTVLTHLDFTIHQNEFVGLVGVNGAGKTTLFKCLLDFCDVDHGRIEIFGRDHREIKSRQKLSYLPERFLAPGFLTGREYLRYMAKLYGCTYDEASLKELLTGLALDPRALEKPVRSLSKGMAQKLGLAACLMSDSELYLLDEPMSGLDPQARALFKLRLLDLKSRGHTLFFSSHLLVDIETLCDRMLVLHQGALNFYGTPETLIAKYSAASLEDAYLQCVAS